MLRGFALIHMQELGRSKTRGLDIGDERFIPFIQLHEFEALLFTDPSHLDFFYKNAASRIRRLRAIANEFSTPELIDDGLKHRLPSESFASFQITLALKGS